MARKSFQIVMNEEIQRRIKSRSSLLGMNIGDFIEMMVSSLESRLRYAYRVTGNNLDPDLDELLIRNILAADQTDDPAAELNRSLQSIKEDAEDTEWTPEVKRP